MGTISGASPALESAPVRAAARGAAGLRARVQAIDRLRGFVIVLMALDHVRLFLYPSFAADPGDPAVSPAYFATRWISHLCAPTFVFLAGISAWLYRRNHAASPAQLSGYLISRGVWLIVLELCVVNLAWNLGWRGYWILQVLWAIGWSMIVLALLVRFTPRTVGLIGLAILVGHNALDGIHGADLGGFAPMWGLLHEPMWIRLGGGAAIRAQYPVLPWIGIMALGYAAAETLIDPTSRGRVLRTALACLAIFLVLRGTNLYGDPRPWQPQDRGFVASSMAFLDVEKYPPSLLFVLMTLGLALLLLLAFEPVGRRDSGWVGSALREFGCVPLFCYVVHLPLAHLAVRAYVHWAYGDARPARGAIDWTALFGLWGLVLIVLYFACRSYVRAREALR
jgi:uncharacterized membrane protein